ncbi:MAG: ZIP family metal transporter, partial [Thermoleophilaceae bacterium]|nr:ZIP family metal transporter [Thermoleophilaceae bacterium]
GVIEVHLRNDGPDPVEVRQTIVNDGFSTFTQSSEKIDRLGRDVVKIDYPWIVGEAYEVVLLTATGGTIPASIEVAAETPAPNAGFFGLLALIGLYVGVIPVAIGMVWLPWLRRSSRELVRFLLALTVGLLAFLGIDALLEGVEFAGAGAQAFGGAALVWLGAVAAYIGLAGVDSALKKRNVEADGKTKAGTLALLVAVGIGLHNLGEGLAIGSAYAIGSLALGAALIVGFAIHNTTEGLAIVAPVAKEPPSLRRLVVLGLIAGAPVILGAVIGATAFNPSLAALMLGLGAGAIAQVAVQIAPSLRDSDGRLLNGITASGLLAGLALMYVTGLLITV